MLLGGEDSPGFIGEGSCEFALALGGVRPRDPAQVPDSRVIGVSVPSRDTEWSEEDRSAATGLFENNRRNAEPTLEERFLPLWISPVSTSPCRGRAVNDEVIAITADNLSLAG